MENQKLTPEVFLEIANTVLDAAEANPVPPPVERTEDQRRIFLRPEALAISKIVCEVGAYDRDESLLSRVEDISLSDDEKAAAFEINFAGDFGSLPEGVSVFKSGMMLDIHEHRGGIIFSNSPKLEPELKASLLYWNLLKGEIIDGNAVFYQVQPYEYLVPLFDDHLPAEDEGKEEANEGKAEVREGEDAPALLDVYGTTHRLLSMTFLHSADISELRKAVVDLKAEFVQFEVLTPGFYNPDGTAVDDSDSDLQFIWNNDDGDTPVEVRNANRRKLEFFVRREDILNAPNDLLIFNACRYELQDYGYYY